MRIDLDTRFSNDARLAAHTLYKVVCLHGHSADLGVGIVTLRAANDTGAVFGETFTTAITVDDMDATGPFSTLLTACRQYPDTVYISIDIDGDVAIVGAPAVPSVNPYRRS